MKLLVQSTVARVFDSLCWVYFIWPNDFYGGFICLVSPEISSLLPAMERMTAGSKRFLLIAAVRTGRCIEDYRQRLLNRVFTVVAVATSWTQFPLSKPTYPERSAFVERKGSQLSVCVSMCYFLLFLLALAPYSGKTRTM